MSVVHKLTNWYFSKSALPYWCVLLLDSILVLFSGYVSFYLQVGGAAFANHFWQLTWGLLFALLLFMAAFRLLHTYSGVLRYSSFVDLGRVAAACLLGALLTALCSLALEFPLSNLPIAANVSLPLARYCLVLFGLSTLLLWLERVFVKTLYDMFRLDSSTKRTFIYGAHAGAISLAKSLRGENPVVYDLKGFIDPDDSLKKDTYLMGVPVYPDDDRLVQELVSKNIAVLFVSPLQSDHFREQTALIDNLIRNKVEIRMMPTSEQWDSSSDIRREQLREVDIEDLLPREKIEVNLQAIGRLFEGTTVMVTGAAGSIGYEMARQVAKFCPRQLVLIDQAETPMHTVRLHMQSHYPHVPCATIVSSITNPTKMEEIFATYKPDYVFHAAAYKHVPMMEDNPSEAVQNNVYGTRVIADLAVKYGAKKFVMISTDKAVNPTNVMGCSKRICEIYCQALNKKLWEETQRTGKPTTQFITTRFGNVLGSNGSVIPLFKKQIAQGGPVTVTHPDIIRFFMLIPEACRLVLEAGTMGHGGEIFVFDMGKPVRIADLAKRMIDLSGAKNVEIKFTGLRDGEKLYEEVLNDAEQTLPTNHPKIMVAKVREYDYALALKNEEDLLALSYTYDDMQIVKKMKEIVPEYRSQHSKYCVLDEPKE